jgi:hypothetical protein
MYISSYSNPHICANDVILFYIKHTNKKNGFIGIGNTSTETKRNTGNVVVYKDNNMNKYILHLRTIILHDTVQRLENFKTIMMDTNINSFNHFATKYIRGVSDCTFKEIPAIIGLILTKTILTNKSNKYNTDIAIKDDSSSNEKTKEDNSNVCINEYKIISNIPIMLLTCDKLKTSIKNINDNNKKISIIINHYKYCSNCDITNNNSTELHMTLNEIKENNIHYETYDYEECLESYISMIEYPQNIDNMYVKIYDMIYDTYYTGDILIEYTSKIFNL